MILMSVLMFVFCMVISFEGGVGGIGMMDYAVPGPMKNEFSDLLSCGHDAGIGMIDSRSAKPGKPPASWLAGVRPMKKRSQAQDLLSCKHDADLGLCFFRTAHCYARK